MNAQNNLITEQIESAMAACAQFDALGITVLGVRIGEQSRAVIEVQYCRACARLESGLYMAVTTHRERLHVRAAEFCGCRVRWRQPAA